MKSSTKVLAAGLVLVIAVGAWRLSRARSGGDTAGPEAASRLDLDWSGALTGKGSLPVTMVWCPGKRIGILEAIDRETGFMLVFHVKDALTLGSYPVFAPEMLTAPLPWAHGAFRLVRDTSVTILEGYSSQSGTVELGGTDAETVSGTLHMVLRRPGRSDTLVVQGSFGKTAVVGRSAGCE